MTTHRAHEGDALIGFTGFVGGNLDRVRSFDNRFNSSNIEQMAGRQFGTVVCAGTSAEKWRANQDPPGDRAGVSRLWEVLRTVVAESVVLISTVDVYPEPRGVDELTTIDIDECHPYGKHRLELERWIAGRFESTVLRLPGLFGPGLRKNALYDLLHAHETDRVDSRGVFQFFDVTSLLPLIERTKAAGVALLNVATEPVSIADVAEECFGMAFVNHLTATPARYDLRTAHSDALGGAGGYLESAAHVKLGIGRWVERERRVVT